jgi:hypothetical protein
MLPEWVRFRKEISKRSLEYSVCDVAKNNFRTHQGRGQKSLLVKQSEEKIETVDSPDMRVGISGNRCNECSNIRGIYGEKVG